MSIKNDNSEKLFQDVLYGIHKLHSSDENFIKHQDVSNTKQATWLQGAG